MRYKLTGHHIFKYGEDALTLFKSCAENKVNVTNLTKNINECAIKLIDPLDYKNKEDIDSAIDKVKGDMFELFAEIFFAQFSSDERFGFDKYRFNEEDYGVDAYGVNPSGVNAVLQIKFRSNPTVSIDYESLAKTYAQGSITGYIEPAKKDTVYLFTNCSGANYIAEKVFGNILHTISKEHINAVIFGNESFWNTFIQMLNENMVE